MKKSALTMLLAFYTKAFALNFGVSPFFSYNDLKDQFYKNSTLSDSKLKVERSGMIAGISASAKAPVFRFTIINKLSGSVAYGVVDGTLEGQSTANPPTLETKKTSNMKAWKMTVEDTVSYFSKTYSRTAPYIGAGYVYDKYRIEDASETIYPGSTKASALVENSKLQGNNKRFYIPFGFIVKATENFSLDLRYEKDFLKKLNKSKVYLRDDSAERVFQKGHGIVLKLDWSFLPSQNTGISFIAQRHAVDYTGSFIGGASTVQKQSENNFIIQMHWFGNN